MAWKAYMRRMLFYILCIILMIRTDICKGAIDYVRVIGDEAYHGNVQVYNGSGWFSLCYDNWDDEDAAVICRMIGYTGDGAQALFEESTHDQNILEQKLDCIGNEMSIQQCMTGRTNLQCNSNKLAGINCSIAQYPDDFVLVDSSLGIGRMDRRSESITVITSNVSSVYDVGYDNVKNMVIWTDLDTANIARCSINGGDVTVLYHTGGTVFGIAVDSDSRLIFHTQSGINEIAVIDADTLVRNVILNFDFHTPYRIAADSQTRQIYWIDLGTEKIEKAFYDGTSREVLVSNGLRHPRSLVLDGVFVYWCDSGNKTIERIFRNGTDRTILYNNVDDLCMDLTSFQEYLYCRQHFLSQISVYKKDETSHFKTGPPMLHDGYSVHYYKRDEREKRFCMLCFCCECDMFFVT